MAWIAILSLLQLVAFWKIFGRMGLPPWLAIPAALPVVSLVVLFYIALTPWPAEARWHEQGGSGTVSPPD